VSGGVKALNFNFNFSPRMLGERKSTPIVPPSGVARDIVTRYMSTAVLTYLSAAAAVARPEALTSERIILTG
jgi:hypothetical protein